MRGSTIGQGVAGIAAVFALAACSGGGTTGAQQPSSDLVANSSTSAAPTATSSVPNAQPSTQQPHTGAAPASVAASGFHAELTIQQPGLGLLALENTGKSAVTIEGWPQLQFLAADDSQLKVPTQNVEIPGPGPSITLRPGTNAFAGVKWETGDKGNPSTFVATTLKLVPPHGSGSTVVDVIGTDGQKVGYPEFDVTSVKVGTLQPSTQGVTVF
ncbi:DUF4232 domain-containing protein [Amycolatopsis sp. FDAARGOS 1241]|uniref:DUF4232 domain-containing protein n=1 Tax=Amycolatopsis sp. FDAARGOS 1241 TaxID=2778070 RepID=UPI00195028F3|nr:DUF4232 domain-containing protein [Amycolatopsis sp. FDAARGOS 1241]QRP47399.1 DUF4232 domain-containing protein [Amycolatopsis sp. FDAARGOS 1241]